LADRVPKRGAGHERLRERLRALAAENRRFGYRRLHALLKREGFKANHKLVARIYAQEKLALRRRTRQKRGAGTMAGHWCPIAANQRWSMDFTEDMLANGRKFRTANLKDDCTRECPAIRVEFSLPGSRVVEMLENVARERGYPDMIVVDNGPEFRGRDLENWAHDHGVKIFFIDPGKPMQNGSIESFNGRFREECLDQHLFRDIDDAREIIENWRGTYNQSRPHTAIKMMPPKEFAKSRPFERARQGAPAQELCEGSPPKPLAVLSKVVLAKPLDSTNGWP
jgi:putative transposase